MVPLICITFAADEYMCANEYFKLATFKFCCTQTDNSHRLKFKMIKSLLKYLTSIISPSHAKNLGFGLLLFLSLSSCSKDDDGHKVLRHYTNTVFVYMPWTGSEYSSNGSLTSAFEQNIRDIKSAIYNGEGAKETRTIVFFADGAKSGRLFEINDDSTETTIRANISNGAMTTEDELKTLLNEVYSYSPTSKYSIIIGSHGDGWLPKGVSPRYSRSFGGQSATMRTDITTLAEAINSSAIKKMQYICFDDCYMANMETVYALRNAANWLIASTSEVMDAGMPYARIWKYLSMTDVDYSSIVSGFGNFYSSYSSPYGALSAIDCSKAEQMASLMRELNQKYDSYSVVPDKLQALDGYSPHVYYDMGSYINERTECDTTDNRQIYEELKEIVPYKFTTPQLYTMYNNGYTFVVRQFSGIAISDPSFNARIADSKKETEWWKATH